MKNKKRIKIFFWVSFTLLTIFSMTFLLMPFTQNQSENRRMMLVIVGMIFWVSFVGGIVSLAMVKHINGKVNKEENIQNIGIRNRLGLFRNMPETIANSLFIGGLIIMIILIVTNRINEYVAYMDISILVFSFTMHFLFEDTLYKRIRNKKEKERKNL